MCIYAFENHEYLKDFASVCQPKKKYQQAYGDAANLLI
ncbi:tetratricopeptide repeat family protein [Escherichia coli 180050]|nr:tetratricopeptide repeat family protein [Escherichia coli 180050]